MRLTVEANDQPLIDDASLRVLLRLGATWAAISRVFERALNDGSVSLPQALALDAIDTAPQPLLLNGLAARLLQEAQSVTSLVDRLERGGLARRVHDLRDRRAIRVELTPDGRDVLRRMRPLLKGDAARLFVALTSAQQQSLELAMVVLYDAARATPGVRLPEWPPGVRPPEAESSNDGHDRIGGSEPAVDA